MLLELLSYLLTIQAVMPLSALCLIAKSVHLLQSMDSFVRNRSVSDILDGSAKRPFTTRSAWLAIQPECSDLRRTCAHLRQGTRPSRKATNIKDIKRYLNVATIANDGLLVVKRNDLFVPSKELIIIPRSVLHGLLTSIHLQLSHPSANPMNGFSMHWIWTRP